MRKVILGALATLACATLLGCGGEKKPADLPELFPTKVTIIQDGKPLEGASVTLNNDQTRFMVGGITNETGVAELKTEGKWKGAPAGHYKVLVSKIFVPEVSNEVPPEDPEARKEFDKKLAEINAQQAQTVDVKFNRPAQTPLELDVAAPGAEAEFDVGEKVNVSTGAGGNH